MHPAPAKFTFDLDLGSRQERSPVVTEAAVAELVRQARSEGRAQGFAEGELSAEAMVKRQLASAAETLAARVAAAAAALDDRNKANLADAVTLSLAIARKLSAALLAQQPTGEIEALIAECLATLDTVPHLVIRCRPDLADAVRDLATARMATSGFTGRLVVLGDPDIGPGDARLEWADGGVVRDMDRISAAVDARIQSFFAARGIFPASSEEQS